MSENTVRKYIRQLEERGLIVTEPTEVITKTGEKRNGNLLFTLRPLQEVIDQHYARQLEELELATERQRTIYKSRKNYQHPRQKVSAVGAVPVSEHSVDFIRLYYFSILY